MLPEDPALEPMARATLPEYLDIAASATPPVPIDREPIGHLLVALEDEDVARAQRVLSSAAAHGVAVRPLNASELRDVEPAVTHHAVAGWLLHHGHRLDPAALTVPEPEDPSVPRRQLAAAIRLVPTLAEASVLSTWWGLRPVTPDERPVVGGVGDGLVIATGHGSYGVILGAGTAKLVTTIVVGGSPPFDPSPFDPFRFDRP